MHSNGEFADVDASLQNRNAVIQADNEQDRQEVLSHLLITNSIPVIKVICHTLSPSYKQQTRTSNKTFATCSSFDYSLWTQCTKFIELEPRLRHVGSDGRRWQLT